MSLRHATNVKQIDARPTNTFSKKCDYKRIKPSAESLLLGPSPPSPPAPSLHPAPVPPSAPSPLLLVLRVRVARALFRQRRPAELVE